MALTKFKSLVPAIDACWIDLTKVEAVSPVMGSPVHKEKGVQVIRPEVPREIGCRVGVGPQVFDLALLAEEIVAEVVIATGEPVEDRTALSGASGSH